MSVGISTGNWITIKCLKKSETIPNEIRIDRSGNIFIDGELYDKNTSKYKDLDVSVERYSKVSAGEETQKMLESQKSAKKGETVVITDNKDPNKRETTIVKY